MSTPTIVMMPGASLMDIQPTANGVLVRCPGCGEVQEFSASGSAAFVHADDCETHRQIEAAIRRYERQAVKRG